MEVVQSADAAQSPREILQQAQKVHPKLGPVTVYRTLNLLAELGLVRRVHREDGCHGYLAATPGHHHVVICQDCGQAVEFSGGDDLDALIARVESSTGYQVEDHLLQLLGVCAKCRHA
jgi:Fur family ferric uptake transcriptional regulator